MLGHFQKSHSRRYRQRPEAIKISLVRALLARRAVRVQIAMKVVALHVRASQACRQGFSWEKSHAKVET